MGTVRALVIGQYVLAVAMYMSICTQIARAGFVYGEPTRVPNANSSMRDSTPQISRDGLELYMRSNRENEDLSRVYVARRETTDDAWSVPSQLDAPVNAAMGQGFPALSPDGLELYYTQGWNIYVITRASKDERWGTPQELGAPINNEGIQEMGCISTDGLSLYYSSQLFDNRQSEIMMTTRPSQDAPWGTPKNLGANINTNGWELTPFISPDGLLLFFSRSYPGGDDVFVSSRVSTTDPWGPARLFIPVDSDGADYTVSFANGDSTIYFTHARHWLASDFDIYQMEVQLDADLNGDGVVDQLDGHELLDHWGQIEDPHYDLAPFPAGDGRVDAKDLAVLAAHIEEHVDPHLLVHWRLSRPEHDTAYDSVGYSNAFIYGNPDWQPEAGRIKGAFQFDGVDDFVETPFVLNPADGSFSVFAWIKGGAAGQVMVSQSGGVDWLLADAQGRLMTQLVGGGRGSRGPVVSETVVTGGHWYWVGLTWDGANRVLYVDGVEVTSKMESNLKGAESGLLIGVGNALDADSFFAGIIQDVRVYNRALGPDEIAELNVGP